MKRISLEVCVCSECVMMGSMDIVESVENLKSLKSQLRLNSKIDISTSSTVCQPKNERNCPVVKLNGERIENASSETVMSQIIALTSSNVTI